MGNGQEGLLSRGEEEFVETLVGGGRAVPNAERKEDTLL